MQFRHEIEGHLRNHSWSKAELWLEKEIHLLKEKSNLQRVLIHSFSVTMSLVLAFFTWVILFPSADEKELAAFPLTTVCHNLFTNLSETVPGGKAVVIIGLLLIPVLVSAVALLFYNLIKPKNFAEPTAKNSSPKKVEEKIKLLSQVYNKYDSGYITLFLYCLFAGIFTGGVMVISSTYGGLNPFEYIFVGIICDLAYAVVFGVCSYMLYSYNDKHNIKRYPIYDWGKYIDDAKENKKTASKTYSRSSDDRLKETEYYKEKYNEYYNMYMGQSSESSGDSATDIVKGTEEDLSGMGFGDY